MNRPDYYKLLHVQPDAPTAIIKASHRTMMQRLKMHPDLGGDHAQAVLLNDALATLSDPDKRAAYDRTLAQTQSEKPSRASDPPRQPPPPSPQPPPSATAAAPTPRTPPRQAPRPRPTHTCGFCAAPVAAASLEWPDAACHACGSALFPARKHQSGEQSRRAIERLPRSMPMTFRRSMARQEVCQGTTEDVSLNGARFVAHVDVGLGERLSIECEFCSAIVVVKSVQPTAAHGKTQRQVGVEFLTLHIKHIRGGLVSSVA